MKPRKSNLARARPASAGYSGTPLPQKLGLLAGAPADLVRLERIASFDCALVFTRSERALAAIFAQLAPKMADTGMIWIGWPKKTSGVVTDLSEDVVRRAGLAAGLVDVKVCAIDATWSGLKFVRRLRDRGR